MNIFHRNERGDCPRCHKKTLKSVPRRGATDFLMRWLKCHPMRCDTCRKVCYKRSSKPRF